jgi:hypothetical protein
MSYTDGMRAIGYMLEKHMKNFQIAPISREHQRVCFDRLKEEAKESDEYNKRLQAGRDKMMEKIVDLFNQGKSAFEIGEFFKITPSVVNKYLRDAGIKQRKSANERTPRNKPNNNRGRPPKPVDET